MEDLFSDARLKIKWADQHISDLQSGLDVFSKSDFCTIAVERNSDASHVSVKFSQNKDIPVVFPLVMGDAIHNIRSALDIAYYSMVRRVGDPSDRTQFKFFDNRNHLVTALSQRVLKAAPDIVELLADEIKPYRTGDDPLRALHDLDIADKHMLVLPTFVLVELTAAEVDIFSNGVLTMKFKEVRARVGKDGILNMAGISASGPNMSVELKGETKPTFTILFGNGQPLEGQPIVPTLFQLSQLVSSIIDKFEKWIVGRPARPV